MSFFIKMNRRMEKNMSLNGGGSAKGPEASISYKLLGLLVVAFLTGILTTLMVVNVSSETIISFKTLDLIGFTLSVCLAGASIILAFAAIGLGKSSEVVLIKRSDESIRLQNDIYIKTTEALNRIETSTDVTEKRIEDIIAGRAGYIAQETVKSAKQGADPKELEEQIKRSLRESLDFGNTAIKTSEKSRQRELREAAYQDAHAKIMFAFANKPGVKVVKMRQDGSPTSFGAALFDGIFVSNENKIGVSTFRSFTPVMGVRTFIFNALEELAKNNISKIYLVLFKDNNEELFLEIKSFLEALQKDFSNKIVLLWDDPESLVQHIASQPF